MADAKKSFEEGYRKASGYYGSMSDEEMKKKKEEEDAMNPSPSASDLLTGAMDSAAEYLGMKKKK